MRNSLFIFIFSVLRTPKKAEFSRAQGIAVQALIILKQCTQFVPIFYSVKHRPTYFLTNVPDVTSGYMTKYLPSNEKYQITSVLRMTSKLVVA